MDKLTSVARSFYKTWEDGTMNIAGYIDVTPLSTIGKIILNIENLHNNHYYIDDDQSTVIIDYPINSNIYDVIMTIFGKLTDDHRYKLDEIVFDKEQSKYVRKEMEYKDEIYCPDEFIKLHPEIIFGANNKYLPFTRENSKYLDDFTVEYGEIGPYIDCIIIYGNVQYKDDIDTSSKLKFIYDAPIIGKSMSKNYYNITRGRIVWDVHLDQDIQEYYVKPFECSCCKEKYLEELNESISPT